MVTFNPLYFDLSTNFEQTGNLKLSFNTINPLEAKLKDEVKNVIAEFSQRHGKEGQFLNWVKKLPQIQLDNLDNMYKLVEEAKSNGNYTKLAVVGIGGSRHTVENITNLFGVDDKVIFFSSVDDASFKRFFRDVNLKETKFMIVSKSGGTLETKTDYETIKAKLEQEFGKEEAKKQFVVMTDGNPEKSALKREAIEANYPTGFIHDDVGGRFSIFDDPTVFALLFSGVSKDVVKRLLEASLAAQDKFLSEDLNENLAMQQAIFNATAKENGANKHFVEYFSDLFTFAEKWETQLKNESIKAKFTTISNVGPAFLHYNAESDLDPTNKDSFYTFITIKSDDTAYNILTQGSKKAYSNQSPLSHIEMQNLSPEAIAELIELKHFETIYTGMLLRRNNPTPMNEALAEVLQPNVEIYKSEARKIQAEMAK